MVKVRVNGKIIEIEPGARVVDIVSDNNILAMRLNGILKDLSTPLTEDCEIELLDFSNLQAREIYWHSTSHIMAMAVKSLFPETKLAIGPAIDQGFYYDFAPITPFSQEDLARIAEKMKEIIDKDIAFERLVMTREAVIEFFTQRNEPYKVELVREIPDEEITLYRNGDFVDLCAGPHIPRTGMVATFKLLSVAGAYWRGDPSQPMLSRIYGISFPTKTELVAYLKKLEEADKRDHRKIGTELELFSFFEEAGAGMVFWHPKGAVLKKIVEDYWLEKHLAAGYEIVSTPHIARSNLWHKSGHYDFYRNKMYTLPVAHEEYVLKPMNCPGHILLYQSKLHSYKELPKKYAELGTVYRYELSGTLQGLLRVRGFTIDDAHIFCTASQINDELVKVLNLAQQMLKKFGFKDYQVELSVWDPRQRSQYLGNESDWERAESGLVFALNKLKLPYTRIVGEAAFYGPKVDIKVLDALARPWQATTVQFDFNLPKRFKIMYVDQDGQHKEVVVIHRAIYGSIERFIGCLIEHYAGAFPWWLAPVQLVVMPITEKENDYAKEIFTKCLKQRLRAELNDKSEKINYRIRESEMKKIPYSLIIGQREVEHRTVSVRKRRRGDIGEMKLNEFFSLVEVEQGGED